MQFFERDAAAISRTDKSANAGAGDHPDRNALFFEDFQNSNVSYAAGKSAA
jgi:hypothetical protein